MATPPGYVSPSYSGSSSEDGPFDELSSAVTVLDDGRGKSNEDAISILDSSDDEESSSVEVVEVVPPDNERAGIKSETKLPGTLCLLKSDGEEDGGLPDSEDRKMPARQPSAVARTDLDDEPYGDNDVASLLDTGNPPHVSKRKAMFKEKDMVEYKSKGGYGMVEIVAVQKNVATDSFEYRIDWKGQGRGKCDDEKWWPENMFQEPSKKRARTRHVPTNVSRVRASISKQEASSNDSVVALKKRTEKALLLLPCTFKEGVISDSLDHVGYPFGLETVMDRIMARNGNVVVSTFPDDEFKIGDKMKKAFTTRICQRTNKVVSCDSYLAEGTIKSVGRCPANKKTYHVVYNDRDCEDIYPKHLRRPLKTEGKRKFHFLEIFSGKGVMSQAFKKLGFTVQSVDINNDKDAVSPPTLQKDIHDFDPANDLTALPDAVHVSIPCETYSNLSGDHHRVVRDSALLDANLDISDAARQADFLLVKVIEVLVYIKIRNPHVIIIIENPKAKLRHMPLMKLLEKCLNLYRKEVSYCAFGRPEKKATDLWTNLLDLSEKLNEYICTCAPKKKHECIRDGVGTTYSVIPKRLAEEIAETAWAHLIFENIHHTKQGDART